MANITTRVTRARAPARIQMRWKFPPDRSSQRIRKKSRFCPRARGTSEGRKRRGSSFFSLPLLFLFFLSSSSRAEESFFFFFFFFFRSRSIKIYSRTEAEILPGLPATSESSHIFRQRNVLFLPFFFFVHARNKLLLLRLSKSVKLGRGVFV